MKNHNVTANVYKVKLADPLCTAVDWDNFAHESETLDTYVLTSLASSYYRRAEDGGLNLSVKPNTSFMKPCGMIYAGMIQAII